jgi:hypothetical protein
MQIQEYQNPRGFLLPTKIPLHSFPFKDPLPMLRWKDWGKIKTTTLHLLWLGYLYKVEKTEQVLSKESSAIVLPKTKNRKETWCYAISGR